MSAKGEDEKMVQYTDLVGTLMTSVTEIVDMISSMMVAFVSISLVVSSIMIGVITYISVLERRKEIGILRAIGASKRNVSEVFNAETFIIGLCSGVMGIVLSEILLIPGNIIIQKVSGTSTLVASLPVDAALFLVALATLLTHSGRHHPGPRRQPSATPSKPCAPSRPQRSHSPVSFPAPAAGIPGFFRLIFAPGPSVQLVSILHKNALFCSKSYKEYGRPREILMCTGNCRKLICFLLCEQNQSAQRRINLLCNSAKVFLGY